MNRARTLLEWLIREVKKHMEAVIVAAAIFFMTLGFYLMFERPEYKIWGGISIIVGLIFWVSALLIAYIKEKGERQKRIEETGQQQARWLVEREESQKLLGDILAELKLLNQSKENKDGND